MKAVQDLISQLGPEIEDPEEETFLLYSQPIASHNLGFIDPKAHSIDVVVNDRDFTIHQSPTILSSSRPGGTTGAVLWKVTPRFAQWLSSPTNPLFLTGALNQTSSVLELGCGISPLNALSLRPKIARYILTDQPYVHKILQQNIDENAPSSSARRAKRGAPANTTTSADIRFQALDWETDQVTSAISRSLDVTSFDAVVACDCVFNYALVQPFVQTCADVCRLRSQAAAEAERPCLAIIAQQLRNDDVFTSWLREFSQHFRVWRFPEEKLPEELRPGAGFVVHIGIPK